MRFLHWQKRLAHNSAHNSPPTALVILFAVLLISGCASIGPEGSYQTIRVQTEPPGASVRVEGKVVGHTPVFVEVRRSVRPKVEVASQDAAAGYREEIPSTHYRLKRSLLGGLVLLSLAPVGWVLDLLTGTAWEASDLDGIKVNLTDADLQWMKADQRRRERPRLAIAPPKSDSLLLSDQAADELEAELKRKGESVLSFHSTLPIFLNNDYDFNDVPVDPRHLYRELSVDGVVITTVSQRGTRRQLRSEIIDLKSPSLATRPGPSLELTAADSMTSFFSHLGVWGRLVPNTIGLDASTERLSTVAGGVSYDMEPIEPEEWWAKGAQYVSAVALTNTPSIRHELGGRGSISAVPMFRFSRKHVRANNLPPPTSGELVERSPTFTRNSVATGYGFEFGYQNLSHYFYLDWVPFIRWSEISWRQNMQTESATRIGYGALTEIGYSFFFKNGMLLKLFSRSMPEDTENWRDAFRARVNVWELPVATSASVGGLVLAYRFQ